MTAGCLQLSVPFQFFTGKWLQFAVGALHSRLVNIMFLLKPKLISLFSEGDHWGCWNYFFPFSFSLRAFSAELKTEPADPQLKA